MHKRGHQFPKGSSIPYLQKVFHFDSNLQKKVPNHCPELFSLRRRVCTQNSDLTPFLGDWSQSEKI